MHGWLLWGADSFHQDTRENVKRKLATLQRHARPCPKRLTPMSLRLHPSQELRDSFHAGMTGKMDETCFRATGQHALWSKFAHEAEVDTDLSPLTREARGAATAGVVLKNGPGTLPFQDKVFSTFRLTTWRAGGGRPRSPASKSRSNAHGT
jgi:hypothetical protein